MSKTSIYDQHRKAFRAVFAYVIVRDGKRVATVAFSFKTAVTAYVHWLGIEMRRGQAGGGGYDRESAAAMFAVSGIELVDGQYADGTPHFTDGHKAQFAAFKAALMTNDGRDWARRLEDAGFQVWEAV